MLEPLFGFLDKMPLISSLIILVRGVMSCYISSGIEAKMRLFRRKISNSALWIAPLHLLLNCRYGLGWRGGRWYATRKFRREQMKLLGQIKPRRWQLLGQIKPRAIQFHFLKRPLTRFRGSETSARTSEKILKDAPTTHNSAEIHQSC